MLTLTRILLCLAVSLSLAGACSGQNSNKSKSGSRKGKSRPAQEPPEISVIGVGTGPSEERQVGRARVIYYGPPSSSVLASVELPEVYRGRRQSIDLSFQFEDDGREVVKPDKVHVMFVSNGAKFKPDHLTLEADGRQLSLNVKPDDFRRISFQFDIDFPTFEQIANSKSVKISLGPLTFELTGEHREALRDLLRTIEAPAPKP